MPRVAGFDGLATLWANIGFELMEQIPAFASELRGADLDLQLAV